MTWDWQFTSDILPDLLWVLRITILATLLGTALAMVLGLILALLRRSDIRAVSLVTAGFIEFVRSTPLLVQLFFLFYGLPRFGISFPALATGIVGLGIHYATYTSEVYRAGIDNVPRGQWEAATALNLPRRRVWTSVVLPQAIPTVVPALGNYLISMFKDTPLLAAIAVVELLRYAQNVGSATGRYLEPITLVGVLFLIVSYLSSIFVRQLEERFGHPY